MFNKIALIAAVAVAASANSIERKVKHASLSTIHKIYNRR
jgi:hypothetical protein